MLAELGCGDTPIINVYNKCDKLSPLEIAPDDNLNVHISAKNGTGIDKLLKAIENNLPVRVKRVKLLLPFNMGGVVNEIREKANLISETYTADGVEVEAVIDEAMYRKLDEYLI